MATGTKPAHAAPSHAAHEDHDDHHPSEKTYWVVGVVLGLITMAEVSTYFITDDPYSHDLKWVLIISLLVMMTLKFAIIGAWFMHLKFDNPIFRRLFVAGLVLAVAVYLAVFFAFEYFDSGYEAEQLLGALG